jgi:hypothetical protein
MAYCADCANGHHILCWGYGGIVNTYGGTYECPCYFQTHPFKMHRCYTIVTEAAEYEDLEFCGWLNSRFLNFIDASGKSAVFSVDDLKHSIWEMTTA